MFAIYNIQGRYFRDSLEKLQRVHKSPKSHSSQFNEDVAQDETLVIQGAEQSLPLADKGLSAYRQMLHQSEREKVVHVNQLMSHPVITLPTSTSLAEAFDTFKKHNFTQLPVLNERRCLVGMLTLLDLMHVISTDGEAVYSLPNQSLRDIMIHEVITTDPVTDIRRAAQVMLEFELTALPVVNDSDQLVGILTRTDILRGLSQNPPLSLWT